MPERSFGRTIRYRRTKLGMSQARLGQLVGRSAATVRSWETDKTTPNDPEVIATLAAIIGIDEKTLFHKVGLDRPVEIEDSPTIEQALASLAPEGSEPDARSETTATIEALFDEDSFTPSDSSEEPVGVVTVAEEVSTAEPESELVTTEEEPVEEEIEPAPEEAVPADEESEPVAAEEEPEADDPDGGESETDLIFAELAMAATEPVGAEVAPSRSRPVPATQVSVVVPTEPSYVEDPVERRFYQVRTLATVAALVLLGIALIWALGQGTEAIGAWWQDFVANLRL